MVRKLPGDASASPASKTILIYGVQPFATAEYNLNILVLADYSVERHSRAL